jgi:S1-C subfamily serine protease
MHAVTPTPEPATAHAHVPPRTWIGIALVAALIGAAVGAGVTAATTGNNNAGPTVTIHEGSASPGAAQLGGRVSVPSLVHKVLPAVVSIDVKGQGQEDQGTGMIISSDGTIVTNNHVIALVATGGGTITVTESGTTKSRPATLVGTDPSHDVALLKVTGASGLPTVTFGNSNALQVGDAVVAIGNALGLAAGTPTVTTGIVSATGRTVQAGDSNSAATETLTNMIQTDAAINPGNSGGPLIDTAGQVIGMNTAVAGASSDGSSAQNIGFAIPVATVESLLPELEKGGVTASGGGYLGVDISTLTNQLRQQYGFTPQQGAVVLNVVAGSPADQAGITQGDVIVDIDGHAITSADALQSTIQKDRPGQQVRITYYNGSQRHVATVDLGSSAAQQ